MRARALRRVMVEPFRLRVATRFLIETSPAQMPTFYHLLPFQRSQKRTKNGKANAAMHSGMYEGYAGHCFGVHATIRGGVRFDIEAVTLPRQPQRTYPDTGADEQGWE